MLSAQATSNETGSAKHSWPCPICLVTKNEGRPEDCSRFMQSKVIVKTVSNYFCRALVQKPPFLHIQRVLAGQTPDQAVAERLTAKPALAKDKPAGRAGP